MQTSCPECRTVFRVSQAQLGLRRGLVRCGKCNAVFNAYDTLLADLEEPPAGAAEPMPDALAMAPSGSIRGPESPAPGPWPGRAEPPPGTPQPDLPHHLPGNEAGDAPETLLADLPESAASSRDAVYRAIQEEPVDAGRDPVEPGSAQQRAEETADAILLSELPSRRPPRPRLPLWQRIGYLLVALPLLGLLPLQAAYFFRADLVAALPESRPGLEKLCQLLGCSVPLPRRLGPEAIAASNLEHDTEQKSRVRLTVLLANRSGQAQAWPTVALTLTDVRQEPVARKLFPPQVYLPQDTPWAKGMADGSEREVRLDLDIGNLAATGYALALVYP